MVRLGLLLALTSFLLAHTGTIFFAAVVHVPECAKYIDGCVPCDERQSDLGLSQSPDGVKTIAVLSWLGQFIGFLIPLTVPMDVPSLDPFELGPQVAFSPVGWPTSIPAACLVGAANIACGVLIFAV